MTCMSSDLCHWNNSMSNPRQTELHLWSFHTSARLGKYDSNLPTWTGWTWGLQVAELRHRWIVLRSAQSTWMPSCLDLLVQTSHVCAHHICNKRSSSKQHKVLIIRQNLRQTGARLSDLQICSRYWNPWRVWRCHCHQGSQLLASCCTQQSQHIIWSSDLLDSWAWILDCVHCGRHFLGIGAICVE